MSNPRPITFGADSGYGTLTIKAKKSSDPSYWWNFDTAAFTTTEPASHKEMSYDTDLEQYYVEGIPTQPVDYSIFDSAGNLVASGYWGGTFPAVVDPGSASAYTMAEVISRIRAAIRDPGGDNPLYTNAELLAILDSCNDWILDQVSKKQVDLGVKRAEYDGDGSTTEWDLPTDFHLALGDPLWPDSTLGGHLTKVTKSDYDMGRLAEEVAYPRYYAIAGGKIYFIDNLSSSQDIYLYYWGRNVALEATATVPWDGVFMSLMVEWGKVVALKGDEFSTSFEEGMLQMFMIAAQKYMSNRGYIPRGFRVGSRRYMLSKGRNRSRYAPSYTNRSGRLA